jgi:hypothetical protein
MDQNPYYTLTDDSHPRHSLISLRDVGLINADRINPSKRSVQVTNHRPLKPDQRPGKPRTT